MSQSHFVSTPLAIILAVSLVAGAIYVGGFGADEPDSDKLVKDVLDGSDGFETITGTRHKEIVTQNDGNVSVTSVTEKVWLRPPDQQRREIISSDGYQDVTAGDVRVINGSTLQWYWTEGERMVVDDEWEPDVGQFDVRHAEEDYETEYVGTDTVAGRETHVVEITPSDNSSVQAALTLHVGDNDLDVTTVTVADANETNVSYTTTWWIDTETGYPLKERIESNANTWSRNRTTVYQEVTFDAEIPDERFTINPPDGTFVYAPPEPLRIETVAEADEAAPFAVAEPRVPERFDLDYVDGSKLRVLNGTTFRGINASEFDGKVMIRLHYRDGNASGDAVWFKITDGPPTYTEDMIVTEDVGDIDGAVVDMARGQTLIYYCDDVRYEITPFIDRDDTVEVAIDIAESTGCP